MEEHNKGRGEGPKMHFEVKNYNETETTHNPVLDLLVAYDYAMNKAMTEKRE